MSTEEKRFELFVSCDDAEHCCDKAQYNESTLFEKIKLNFHLLFCRACRKYVSKNGKLTELIKKENANKECFHDKEKNDLEELFRQQIKQAENSN